MLWIFAALTLVPPVFGLFGTVAGMIGAMDTMGLEGGSDPEKLAENISLALMTTAGGLVVSILALPVFVFSLVKLIKLTRELASETPQQNKPAMDKPDNVVS